MDIVNTILEGYPKPKKEFIVSYHLMYVLYRYHSYNQWRSH